MDASAKANILLVDDERRNLVALRELLAGPGRNLLLANSGEDALRLALRHDFAVVLLDVRMPRIDGFETARLLRERERSRLTPVIFLTAAADEFESMFRGYEVGAVDYLVKPLVPEVLRSKVAVFVELHAKSDALAREIAERRGAEQRLLESEQRLRALTAHLVSVREEERASIAREIHDELGQVLTGLKMDVTWLAARLEAKPLLHKTESMCELIDATVRAVRRISAGLRPEVLDDMGLLAGIGWQAKEFQKRTGIRCRVKMPVEGAGFGSELSINAFRIFQEILTNVARHAKATRVEVALSTAPDRLVLEVADNGVGIAARKLNGKGSLGLLGMRERALRLGGEVNIDSVRRQGTRIVVSLPRGEAGA
jgi:signal transduction histidine kinase